MAGSADSKGFRMLLTEECRGYFAAAERDVIGLRRKDGPNRQVYHIGSLYKVASCLIEAEREDGSGAVGDQSGRGFQIQSSCAAKASKRMVTHEWLRRP